MAADLHQKLDIEFKLTKIRGLDVLIGRLHGKIVDIRIPLDDAENYQLNTHFDDKHRRWQTSCYTYIFQNELAAFEQKCLVSPEVKREYPAIGDLAAQLRTWSEQYAALEAMINNPPHGLTRDSLGALYNELVRLQELFPNQALRNTLNPQFEQFKKDILSLYNKSRGGRPLSKGDIRRFFSIQQEDRRRPCLGKFLADQMTALTEYGSERVYQITDENPSRKPWNRFKQLFAMHPLLKRLSDANAYTEQKGMSLYAARFNNSRDPIPEDMLEVLKSRPRGRSDEKWTSLIPYLERPDDLEEIDALLIEMAKNKDLHRVVVPTPKSLWERTKYWGRQILVFLANVGELPLALGLRLAPSLVLALPVIIVRSFFFDPFISAYAALGGPQEEKAAHAAHRWCDKHVASFIYAPLAAVLWASSSAAWLVIHPFAMAFGYSKQSKNAIRSFHRGLFDLYEDPLTTLDSGFEKGHQALSLVKLAKRNRNNNLPDIDTQLKKPDGLNQPVTQFDVLLSELNITQITGFFTKGIDTIITTVLSPIKLLADTVKARWDRGMDNTKDYQAKVFNRYNTAAMHAAFKQYEQQLNQQGLANAQQEETKKFRHTVKPWAMNEISSPLDFLDEIFVGLSDSVIGPMFRKSPGLATTFFIFANISLASLMVPAMSSTAYTSWLKFLPKHLSEGFMGKHAGLHQGMINKIFAVFLQWKITFFAAEAGMEIMHGDLDFLKALLHNPEKITLATGVMVAMGLAMNWLPDLDPEMKLPLHKLSGEHLQNMHFTNYYIEALNIFSHEAKEVTEFGTPPLTGIEYAFLSLKSIFLVEDMMSGGHKGHDHDVSAILGLELDNTGGVKKDPVKDIIRKMHEKHAALYPKETLAKIYARDPEGIKIKLIRAAVIDYCTEHTLKLDEHKLQHCTKFIFDNVIEAISLSAQTERESKKNVASMSQSVANQDQLVRAFPPHRKKLMDAIQAVQRMELTGKGFDSTADATAFYDYLYQCFKDYNNAQRRLGRWDQQVDKEQFLHAFYNKHIYKGSNNFMRLVSIFPFYPLTMLWRGFQFAFSDSAATGYKIKRSFRKDGVMALQSIAMGGRVGHEIVRAYTYGMRGVLGAAAVLTAIPVLFVDLFTRPFQDPQKPLLATRFLNSAIDLIPQFRPFSWLYQGFALVLPFLPALPKAGAPSATYSRISRVAGTGSENLSATGKDIKKQLLEHASHAETNRPILMHYVHQHKKGFLESKTQRKAEKELLTAYAEFETRVNDLMARNHNLQLDTSGILRNAMATLNEFKNANGGFKLPTHSALIKNALSRMENHKLELDNFDQVLKGAEKPLKPRSNH